MAMLTLNGIVQNVFRKTGGHDKKTGEIIPPSDHVQIMAENVLQNGEKRMELVTLKVEHPDAYRKLLGRPVRVPVGAFVSGMAVQFYALKGQIAPTGDA
jgi:hypothetical protein